MHDAGDRRILVQREVRSRPVVIIGVELENFPEMTLAKDHDVIEALTAHRANEPFAVAARASGL
jgi:hypothetical protein